MTTDKCECRGFGFFWSFEIEGYRGPIVKFKCRRCCKLSLPIRIIYWIWGYRSNAQYTPGMRSQNVE